MNRIREYRRNNGLLQSELAKLLNVSQGTISQYETGNSEPDNETLKAIARIFNVSVDEILGYDKDTKAEIQPADISDIEFALSGAIRDLTDDEKQDVLDYVRFKRAQKLKQQ